MSKEIVLITDLNIVYLFTEKHSLIFYINLTTFIIYKKFHDQFQILQYFLITTLL